MEPEYWTPPGDIDIDRLGSIAMEAAASQPPDVRVVALDAVCRGEAAAGPDDEKDDYFSVWVQGLKLCRVHRSRCLKVADPDAN